jgi:hypothetical protein
MTQVTRSEPICRVLCISNRKELDAEVMSFNESRNLTVVLNKSVKLHMTWNGRCYEGRSGGLDFESYGPKVVKTQTSIRG